LQVQTLKPGLASILTSAVPVEHKIKAVGVQLYTVRDAMKSDFEGTIAKVAQLVTGSRIRRYLITRPKISAAPQKNGLTSPLATWL